MNLVYRDKDIIFGKKDLELLYSIKNMPAKMGSTSKNKDSDTHLDMDFYISEGSGMIQINPLLPLDFLYENGHGAGTTGQTWDVHHNEFSEFLNNFNFKRILEVGGGHGKLSSINLQSNKFTETWTILEPSLDDHQELTDDRIKYIQGFFSLDIKNKFNDLSAIVHSHLFEHLYDPIQFLDDAFSILNKEGLVMMSVPNLKYMLNNNHANAIMFEHSYYASEEYIEYMFLSKNFELLKKKYFKNHSIFYCFKKKIRQNKEQILKPDQYALNKKLFLNYINHIKEMVSQINIKKNKFSKNQTFIFGAHIFSQILLSMGIDEKKIFCVLDNDSKKINKRLYGTSLKIESPEVLRNINEPCIILNAGNYNQEIKKQINDNINNSSIFIEM